MSSIDLMVDYEDATYRLTYMIDKEPLGLHHRDSISYYFGSQENAEKFRQLEKLSVGEPYISGYTIVASVVKRMVDR